MWLSNLDLEFKVHRTVAFDLNLLCIGLTYFSVLPHVNHRRNQLVFLAVDDGEGVNGNGDFVAFTVDPNTVVVVVVLLSRRELNVDSFFDTTWNHSFFLYSILKS
jgi:hypothetical protein